MRDGERPHILHVITRMDAGGAATNTLLGMDGVRNHGFDVTLVYGRTNDPDGSISARVRDMGIPAVLIPFLVRDVSPISDLRAAAAIYRIMKAGKFALVHTHTSKAGALGRIAARCLRTPVIHTPHGHIFYGYFGPLGTTVYTHVERFLARWSHGLVSLTEDETIECLKRAIGRREQFHTIPSGVPLAHFMGIARQDGLDLRHHWGLHDKSVLFVSAGRLVPIKGFDSLLRSFAVCRAHNPHCFLGIVGDGPERASLEKLAASLGVDRCVRFAGHMHDIRPALSAADVFVLASKNEGMGRVIVEAMAAGLPVIATKVGGIVNLLRSNDTGILVAKDDTVALADAMRELADDRTRRLRMGACARAEVYPEYDLETMVARLADLYRQTIAGTGKT